MCFKKSLYLVRISHRIGEPLSSPKTHITHSHTATSKKGQENNTVRIIGNDIQNLRLTDALMIP